MSTPEAASDRQEPGEAAPAADPAGETMTRRALSRVGRGRGVIPPAAAEELPERVARLAQGRLPLLDALQRRWDFSAADWPDAVDLPLVASAAAMREVEWGTNASPAQPHAATARPIVRPRPVSADAAAAQPPDGPTVPPVMATGRPTVTGLAPPATAATAPAHAQPLPIVQAGRSTARPRAAVPAARGTDPPPLPAAGTPAGGSVAASAGPVAGVQRETAPAAHIAGPEVASEARAAADAGASPPLHAQSMTGSAVPTAEPLLRRAVETAGESASGPAAQAEGRETAARHSLPAGSEPGGSLHDKTGPGPAGSSTPIVHAQPLPAGAPRFTLGAKAVRPEQNDRRERSRRASDAQSILRLRPPSAASAQDARVARLRRAHVDVPPTTEPLLRRAVDTASEPAPVSSPHAETAGGTTRHPAPADATPGASLPDHPAPNPTEPPRPVVAAQPATGGTLPPAESLLRRSVRIAGERAPASVPPAETGGGTTRHPAPADAGAGASLPYTAAPNPTEPPRPVVAAQAPAGGTSLDAPPRSRRAVESASKPASVPAIEREAASPAPIRGTDERTRPVVRAQPAPPGYPPATAPLVRPVRGIEPHSGPATAPAAFGRAVAPVASPVSLQQPAPDGSREQVRPDADVQSMPARRAAGVPAAQSANPASVNRQPEPGVIRVWGEPIVQRARDRRGPASVIPPNPAQDRSHPMPVLPTTAASAVSRQSAADELSPVASPPVVRPDRTAAHDQPVTSPAAVEPGRGLARDHPGAVALPRAHADDGGLTSASAPVTASPVTSSLPVTKASARAPLTPERARGTDTPIVRPRADVPPVQRQVTRESAALVKPVQARPPAGRALQRQESSAALPFPIQRQAGGSPASAPPAPAGDNPPAAAAEASAPAPPAAPGNDGRVRLDDREMERVANNVLELLKQRLQMEREARGL